MRMKLNDYAMTRIMELKDDPISALDEFHRNRTFRGPQTYFHIRTLIHRNKFPQPKPSLVTTDPCFMEYLYATLPAWGIGGRGNRRLVEFREFKEAIKGVAPDLDHLSSLRIEEIPSAKVDSVTCDIWKVIDSLEITDANAKLISGSKAICHLIPDLMMPMDVVYTSKFFGKGNQFGQYNRQEPLFRLIFPKLIDIARCIVPKLSKYTRREFDTSIPKTLDNSIIGFMELEKKVESGE